VARHARYRDVTNLELSTHPPTRIRLTNLAETADYLAAKRGPATAPDREGWAAIIRPYQAALLREQVYLNDAGASLYLLEALAADGWTGLLRFEEGEVYRLRNEHGDALRAAAAYDIATTFADAPSEAWRAHGYALLRAGSDARSKEALNRYLAMNPRATDEAAIRFASSRHTAADGSADASGHLTVGTGSDWKRIRRNPSGIPWEELWTRNGPQTDRMALIDGLPDGKAIVYQQPSAESRVPVFRAGMSTYDLASMLEVSYRVQGVTMFDIESAEPVEFLGGSGVRLRYRYASGIVFAKRGSCVMRVIDRKLYAMKLEGVANPAFDAVAAEFDQLVASARLRQ
jgi:hypothetical protein